MKEGCPECGGGEPMKLGLLDPQVDDENQKHNRGGEGGGMCVVGALRDAGMVKGWP